MEASTSQLSYSLRWGEKATSPRKRGARRSNSPRMQPTDHISMAVEYCVLPISTSGAAVDTTGEESGDGARRLYLGRVGAWRSHVAGQAKIRETQTAVRAHQVILRLYILSVVFIKRANSVCNISGVEHLQRREHVVQDRLHIRDGQRHVLVTDQIEQVAATTLHDQVNTVVVHVAVVHLHINIKNQAQLSQYSGGCMSPTPYRTSFREYTPWECRSTRSSPYLLSSPLLGSPPGQSTPHLR